jgi:hypothetical protein
MTERGESVARKKGALQLSINAIVVLILAITILGLGLGFIRTQFSSLTKQVGEISEEIEGQIIEKIKESGDLLVFNRNKISAKVGKTEEFYMGIKNTDTDPACFQTAIKCVRALKSDNYCDKDFEGNNVLVGGKAQQGIWLGDNHNGEGKPESRNTWVNLFDEIPVESGDVFVNRVKLQIAGALPDTYLMEVGVFKGNSETGDCTQGVSWIDTPWQKKQFFVDLS